MANMGPMDAGNTAPGAASSPHDDALFVQSTLRKAAAATADATEKFGGARGLETIMRIPVVMQVVLGSATMPVANLMKLGRGAIVPLDHRIGEPVDVVVNGRVIARGEVVVVDEDNSRFGVSLSEIAGISGRLSE